jgi:hypothetical protein
MTMKQTTNDTQTLTTLLPDFVNPQSSRQQQYRIQTTADIPDNGQQTTENGHTTNNGIKSNVTRDLVLWV